MRSCLEAGSRGFLRFTTASPDCGPGTSSRIALRPLSCPRSRCLQRRARRRMVVAAGVRVVKTLCRAFGTAVGNAAGLLGRGEDHRGAIAPTPPHTIFAETTLAPEECDA